MPRVQAQEYLWFKERPGEVFAAVFVDVGGRQVGW